MVLVFQIGDLALPEHFASPIRKVGLEFVVIHLRTAPRQEIDNPHGPQDLHQTELAVVEFCELLVALEYQVYFVARSVRRSS